MVRAFFTWLAILSGTLSAATPSPADVLASDRQSILQANAHPGPNGHWSFIDQLYGDVVLSPATKRLKEDLVTSGKLHEPSVHENKYFELDSLPQSPLELVSRLDKIRSQNEKTQRALAHQGYLASRAQCNFPDDDDTRDLASGENMFGGIVTFGHLRTMNCFDPQLFSSAPIDIAIVGAPFDTGTSYRPGARFGPDSIRQGARRLGQGVTPVRGNVPGSRLGKVDPYDPSSHNLTIVDCGDIPMTPFDNRVALNQLYRGQRAIHNHTTTGAYSLTYPKIITMGGDHTISLLAIRSVYEKYGKVAVLHFDSHIDTWDPKVLGGGITDYMALNHGTFLHYAAENGYLEHEKCFHLGLRAPYIDPAYDKKHDQDCGFNTITARDMDRLGYKNIVETVKSALGDTPVYISVDIDVLDPAFAPGTGTMEVGGWTTRELLSVLDGLEGLNIVGGDVVEVSPPYDSNSEVTSLAATAVIDSLMGLMIVQTLD